MAVENYTGADCTLNSGDSNRVLTLSNNSLTTSDDFSVFVSGLALSLNTEYTVNHKVIGTEITFLNPLWDDMAIIVTYSTKIQSSAPGVLSEGIIDSQIEIFGELVTLTVKSNKTYSDWGDESITETDLPNVKAVYNVYGQPSMQYPEGKFQSGEISFFFKSDQTGIVRGTKITRSNGSVYSISDTMDFGIQGNIYVQEVKVKKI